MALFFFFFPFHFNKTVAVENSLMVHEQHLYLLIFYSYQATEYFNPFE